MAEFVNVGKTSDVAPGTGKVVEAGGKTLALFNVEGQFYAMDNTCPHRGGPLGEGSLEATTVTCPWHAWEYDLTNGQCQDNESVTVQTFEVKVEGEDILVAL